MECFSRVRVYVRVGVSFPCTCTLYARMCSHLNSVPVDSTYMYFRNEKVTHFSFLSSVFRLFRINFVHFFVREFAAPDF